MTNSDGSFDPFGGFDWSKAGNAVTSGPIVNGGTVTSTFWANAIAIVDTSSNPFSTPGLRPPGSDYEYTVLASITETVTCAGNPGDACGNNATFTVQSGNWSIYYDTSPNANLVTGTGVTDGTLLLQGTVDEGGGNFSLFTINTPPPPGLGGIGSFFYTGTVTYTNNDFVNPDLVGSTAAATLQFGKSTTSWTRPTGMPTGTSGGATVIPAGALVFQADGNQSFTVAAVPEPGTLALLAAAILGIGFVRRRSK